MAILTIDDLSIRFNGPPLLDGVSTVIEPGQRIGLMGRNGAGKSTFLKLIAGQIQPDHGNIAFAGSSRVAMLPQDVPDLTGTVREVVSSGVARASNEPGGYEIDDWEVDLKAEQIVSRMSLDIDADVSRMSSGMKRRVLLAKALVDTPDLLLLDEPTNHLDIDAIRWLEDFMMRWEKAYMFITHDRQFLRRLANRILEIEGGQLFDWTCDYDTFLRRKDEALAAQEKQNALFDKKLAEEEAWIRQGIKARRTRNEGRVRALKQLREIRSERREKVGTSNLQIQETQRSGNLVVRAKDLFFSRDNPKREIIGGFSTTIMRGDKVGIVGPNGAGKTTLLKLLLGELKPDSGDVKLGTNLQVAYFDQLRAQLDPTKTIEEDVSDGYQTIDIGGTPRHVLGYLQDFLFTPSRARTQIKQLSGGERNRVLLAKLFAKPANIIILDEPTNDLDAETLEMLEERLVEYKGTLLVVSHDREFLNNVVSSTIVFEPGSGTEMQINEYVGGYDDWLRISNRRASENARPSTVEKPASEPTTEDKPAAPAKRKLSFKEQKELKELPSRIEKIEAKLAELHATMAEPEFYKESRETIASTQADVDSLQADLESAFSRWEELDS
ncbi:MAG: ATP-binding cassette domain-containing protein [Aureliella sp.]